MVIIGVDDPSTDCTQTNNLQSITYWKLVDTGYQGGEILEITWKEREEKYLRFSPLTNFRKVLFSKSSIILSEKAKNRWGRINKTGLLSL